MTTKRIAVLGGGILGTCTALELARRGRQVTLVEGSSDLLQGASRWNEGKIHLGFLYAADQTLGTAVRLIPGGMAFPQLVSRLVGTSLDQFMTDDEVFLVHRDSVADAHTFGSYAARVSSLLRDAASAGGAPRYLRDLGDAQVTPLSASELADATSSGDVVAGFRVPERSVSTIPVADLLRDAVMDNPLIEVRLNTWVNGVRRLDDGRFDVLASGRGDTELRSFDVVVNALWEGRPSVDASIGIMPPAPWSHRFRAALFANAPNFSIRGAVLCVGPFGDIKRYSDGRLYLSWYKSGLLAEGHELEPPRDAATMTEERRRHVAEGTIAGLAEYFPAVRELREKASELTVNGGWVYAIGQGSLADRDSMLHRRDQFELIVDHGYISADTAKYSLAPWIADDIAGIIVGE